MVNSNPETVSTDYDTSDLLFFEPLTLEDTLNVIERLNGGPLVPGPRTSMGSGPAGRSGHVRGVIVQFGGQTPLNLAHGLDLAGAPIIGTSLDSIDLAEDRDRFDALLERLGLERPASGISNSLEEAVEIAARIGYPVLVRPSYVLGGRGMEICSDEASLRHFITNALAVSEFTRDPDATRGWGTGRFAKGFRVHALIDDAMRIIAWDARGLNEAECVVAADLVRDARDHGLLPPDATVIADASYDSNPLHAAVHDAGSRLLAPRRRPDRPLAANRRHHPARIEAVRFTEHDPGWERLRLCVRTTIERVFGIVAGGACRLHALPPWVRRIHRVKLWVSAKLVVYAASWAHRHAVDA